MQLCVYGCEQQALFQLKNGKWCCSSWYNSCPALRKKVAEAQTGSKNHYFGKVAWNKGLTKEDPRIRKNAYRMKRTKRGRKYVAWNKGLDKKDPRVLKYALSVAKAKLGVPNLKLRTKIGLSKDKTIGCFRVRFKKKLYIKWIFPCLERDEFKCTICGTTEHLEVHHLLPYRIIFERARKKLGLHYKEWKYWGRKSVDTLEQEILKRHKLSIGVTVCIRCHSTIDPWRKRST